MAAQPVISQGETALPENLLQSPRRAVHTFLHWQQEGHRRPDLVIQTFKLSDKPRDKKVERARQLRRVLDARGLLVDYDQVPGDPAWTDSLSGQHQYILFDALPEVYLVRHEGEWLFSQATIEQIPEIYGDTFSFMVEAVVDNLPDALRGEWMGLQVWQYLAIFLWLLTGFVLRKVFEYFFENYGRGLVSSSTTQWDDRLLHETEKPVSFLFMMGFYWATFTNLMLSVTVNYYLALALEVAFSASFVWLFYNLSNVFSEYLMKMTSRTESKLDDQLVPLLRKTLKVFVLVIGIIFILQNHGINVASLLAGLGLGGLAIALAARETLANFFGSITIFTDKPFQVGDWIVTDKVEGTVEEVGFRSTRIRTFYNSLVSVPNSKLADSAIDNMGLREYRRLRTVLNLTYDTTADQMEAFTEGIRELVRGNEHIRQDFFEVHFSEYGPHSLDVMVYIFFDVPDWSTELRERHRFLLNIKALAEDVGVEFAFPTRTLHMESLPPESGLPSPETSSPGKMDK
ncbi:MAG: mechanosensitive ion channel family protein [Balneolaceae bacterium]|nr:mechanosensitive ion channel family protein [Balneolaceae bacterium]